MILRSSLFVIYYHLIILIQLFDIGLSVSEEVLSCLRLERSMTENPAQNIITVTAQQPAYLHCKVPDGTNHIVAWTRSVDQALLTAGHQSFTSDSRFQVSRKSNNDWILILRRADIADTGCYLCEINTEPVSTVYSIFLNVQEYSSPSTYSLKRSTKLMANMAGDEVLLNCTISLGESTEDNVIWTRNGKAIDLNNTSKYIWKVKRATGVVVHTVRIRSATMDDDGDYACENQDQKANQIVHVNKAEAQRSSTSSVVFSLFLRISTVLLIAR